MLYEIMNKKELTALSEQLSSVKMLLAEVSTRTHYMYCKLEKLEEKASEISRKLDKNFYELIALRKDSDIPRSVFDFMIIYNLTLEEALCKLIWFQSNIPFVDIDAAWKYLLENHNTNRWIIFENYIYFLFRHGDLLGNMYDTFRGGLDFYQFWTMKTKLLYISFLIWSNFDDEALKWAEKYYINYGAKGFDLYLPVAYLVKNRLHVSSETIDLSCKQYESLMQNEGVFENLLADAGAGIALVGNSPCEQGKGNGFEIDSHDIVIRMNDYKVASDFTHDYGEKVSIWANCVYIPSPQELFKKGKFKYLAFRWKTWVKVV